MQLRQAFVEGRQRRVDFPRGQAYEVRIGDLSMATNTTRSDAAYESESDQNSQPGSA